MTSPPKLPPGTPPPPVPDESQAPEPGASRANFLGRRIAIVSVGAAVLLGAGLYAAAYASAGSDVKKGTTVLGIDIGGLTRSEAEAKLTEQLPAVVNRTVTVSAGSKTFELSTTSSGITIDARATVLQAGKRSLNPGDLLPVLFGAKDELPPVLAVDQAALSRTVSKMAAKVDKTVREGRVGFEAGKPKVTKPREGRKLLVPETEALLREAYESGATTVTAPLQLTPPVIGQAEVDRVLTEFAGPAMSGPVTVTLQGTAVTLDPAELDDYLKIKAEGATLQWTVDTDEMATDLADDNAKIVQPPKDASFTFVKNKPNLVPGEDGERIDLVTFGEQMRQALVATAGARTFAADVVPAEPELTTAEAQNLGIVERISTFRTNYPIAPYRVTNIGRAAELINGSLVLPGKIWSLNDTVGERTRANGFVKGFIIDQGDFKEELGGGVSQSATTTFNAVFFAGLEDVEHHPHSLYIGRYPAGREATVAFGSKDLRFRNNFPTGILIQAQHEPGYIRVSMWGTKQFDKIESVSSARYNFRTPANRTSSGPKCIPQSPVTGFDIDVTRVFYKGGKVVKREKFHTRYEATDRITCV